VSTTSFSWQTLRAIIGGTSALDLPRLNLGTLTDADEFLTGYGFDWTDPSHRAEVLHIRSESLTFIEEELLPPPADINREVWREEDVRKLLLWASANPDGPEQSRQRWSCALLRVMHTRAHVDSHLQDTFGPQIRDQILDRFRPHLKGDPQNLRLGDGEYSVPLVGFEMKSAKPWRSVLSKLLHKPENVAADVFDHIGVRFITPTRLDALRAVYYLRANNVVMFTNIKPTRSRNTLVDLSRLEAEMDGLDRALADGTISPADRQAALHRAADRLAPMELSRAYNRFTDDTYRSIQFTSRQMVRAPTATGLRPARFFFPYEVQILDHISYERARNGRASHEVYKARQREAIRQRVLGPLVAADEVELSEAA